MLPCCRAAVLPCCRAAVLPRCRAAALDVLLPRHPGRHRAGRPRIYHEFIRVRCDVSGSCLSKMFLRAYHTLQRWFWLHSDRRRPVPAACSCSEKKTRQEHFRGSYLKKEIPKKKEIPLTECKLEVR